MFGISMNRVTREFEAKLRASDGGAKLTVQMRGLDLPNGTAVTVYFGDWAVAVLETDKGAGHLRLESGESIAVPTADDG